MEMEKEQYLKSLENVLIQSFSEEQTNDILADYTEFFDAGIAEEKSESELCAEFGSPESVAKELAKDNSAGQKQKLGNLWLKIVLIFATALLFILLPHFDGLITNSFVLFFPLTLQAIIFTDFTYGRSAFSPITTKLFYIRQTWFSGWRLIVILLLSSIVLSFCIINCFVKKEFYFLYVPILAFVAFICILRFLYPVKSESFRGMKTTVIVCYSLIFALFAALSIFAAKQQNTPGYKEFILASSKSFVAFCYFVLALSIFTAILTTIYAIHVNRNAKWLIFLSTTSFIVDLNFATPLITQYQTNTLLTDLFSSSKDWIIKNFAIAIFFALFSLIVFIFSKPGEKRKAQRMCR